MPIDNFFLKLCDLDRRSFKIRTDVTYENGSLIFAGDDYRPEDDDDYYYGYLLDKEATEKLFNLIQEEGKTIQESLLSRFHGADGFSNLERFCQTNNIPFRFSGDKYELGY